MALTEPRKLDEFGPGFHLNMLESTYRSDPCLTPSLNQSTANLILRESPWHAQEKHPRLGGVNRVSTPQMDRGTILHAILLGQPLGALHLIKADNFKKKDTQLSRDAAKSAGKLVMLEREFNLLMEGVPRIISNLKEAGIELNGKRELCGIWNSDGVICRTKMDHVSEDMTFPIDLKCTENANPKWLEHHIDDMGYNVQAAAEVECIETLKPELVGRIKFADVFIEVDHPHFVVVADYSESMMMLGQSKWKRAKRVWAECLRTGVWRGFTNRVIVHAPARAMNKEFGESI
jgi:PDDEXK-like domain of unknown function (DUF3799)